VLLEDLETGKAVEVAPGFMRDVYPGRIRAHIAALETAAAGIGADHVLVRTSDSLDRALRNYLLFRQRRV
jgi:hypothetical protein